MTAEAAGADAPTTRIGVSFRVAPLGDINGDLANLLGRGFLDLLSMFYPTRVGKKANVVVTELIQNVVQNVAFPDSELRLELHIDADALIVRVTNKATPAQYADVRDRVAALDACDDPRRLLTATLRARRADHLRGGLGLMRLVSENHFRLAVSYDAELLTMQAAFPLRGSP